MGATDRDKPRIMTPADADLEEAANIAEALPVGTDDLRRGMLHTQIGIGGALLRIEELLRTFVKNDSTRHLR